jgi:hypothetical protein
MMTSPRSTTVPAAPTESVRPLRPHAIAAQKAYEELMSDAKAEFERVTTQHLAVRARGREKKAAAAADIDLSNRS